MAYADYDFYKNEYFGASIEEADFPRLALRGSQYIDYITQGRAQARSQLEAVKMACCILAEQYQVIEMTQALAQKSLGNALSSPEGELSSQSVGDWSKSYLSGGDSAQSAANAAAAAQSELYAIAQRYLGMTGLLYRGIGRCRREGMTGGGTL